MSNIFRMTLLLGALTGLLVLVGRFVGGPGGMIVAFIFAVVINFGSYWYSDKIVLKMYHAKEVSPSEAPELHSIVDNLILQAKLPKPKVYLMNSATPNAFATGRNKEHAAVAVTTGILQLLSREELEGVLAHELAHVKNRDILIQSVAATMAGVITMLAVWARWAAIFGGFGGRDRDGDGGGLMGFLFLAILAPIAATLIQLAISRSREYLADETGARITKKPYALASALKRLEYGVSRAPMDANPATAHLFIVNPLRKMSLLKLFSTHPPTPERVARLQSLVI
ncbi:MAG: zinc metalloprotease HtpX [Candidatus Hydrothermarchaeales archaeon]